MIMKEVQDDMKEWRERKNKKSELSILDYMEESKIQRELYRDKVIARIKNNK